MPQPELEVLKIFIGSSSEFKGLAEALSRNLGARSNISPRVWTKDVFVAGSNFLGTLVGECKSSDLAVILLTPDDKAKIRGKLVTTPRGNTVFELGLFIGGLGLDPQRCIVLSSLDAPIFSDFWGIHVLKLGISGENISDDSVCDRLVAKSADEIVKRAELLGRYHRPVARLFTAHQLAKLERVEEGGELLRGRNEVAVFVNCETPPLEAEDQEFAGAVLKNIASELRYCYIWNDNFDHWRQAVNMLSNIAGRGSLSRNERLENLRQMQSYISIHFRNDVGIQFCVHNASRGKDDQVCYLRYDSKTFVRLPQSTSPKLISQLQGACKHCRDTDSGIFHADRDELTFKELRRSVLSRMQKEFGDSSPGMTVEAQKRETEELESICFGKAT